MKNAIITILKITEKAWLLEGATRNTKANWYRDPLSHPDIARMSERERADLQFKPEFIKSE